MKALLQGALLSHADSIDRTTTKRGHWKKDGTVQELTFSNQNTGKKRRWVMSSKNLQEVKQKALHSETL